MIIINNTVNKREVRIKDRQVKYNCSRTTVLTKTNKFLKYQMCSLTKYDHSNLPFHPFPAEKHIKIQMMLIAMFR